MEIRVGKFLKEINSTKQIDVSGSTTPGFTNIEVKIKEPCSILSPVIIISNAVYDPEWNYCYIYLWKRFYFMHDATIQPGQRWEVQLGVDVLATWKSYILNATAYVARSASNWSNYIPDSTWSHNSNILHSSQEIDVGLGTDTMPGGVYLLFTTSGEGGSVAGVPSQSVYAVSTGTLVSFMQKIFSNNMYQDITAGLQDPDQQILAKLSFNPFQYVTRCIWFPLTMNDFTGDTSTVKFGWWDSQIGATYLTSFFKKLTFSFTLGSYNSWKDRAPDWTQNELYVPGFPAMQLPCNVQGQNLTGTIYIDYATGDASLKIMSGSNLVQMSSGKIGCDVQLSSLYKDYVQSFSTAGGAITTGIKSAVGGIGGLISGVRDVLTGNGTLRDIISNVGKVADSAVKGAQAGMAPTMSTLGANGSRALIYNEHKAILTTTTFGQLSDNHERLGGMCCQTLQLSTLSGYTEVVNPKIDAPCSSGETSMINAFMSGGFYIE